MEKIKPLLKKVENKIRRLRFYHKRKKILNNDVTILSNTCVAGIVYNTLNLEFLSPTINLTIWGEGFINFITHLKEYIENGYFVSLNKKIGSLYGPYALLKCEKLPDIEVVFTHYREFDEAVTIWNKRAKRINYSKIFLLVEARYDYEINLIDKYLLLPYLKAILTSSIDYKNHDVIHMNFYDKYGKEKSITEFISPFGKRGIDEFDFVESIFNIFYFCKTITVVYMK